MSATSTLSLVDLDVTAASGGANHPSFGKRLLARMIAGQERRARAIVRAHLAHADDAALARLGWSQTDIAALRREAAIATRI